MAFMMEDSMAYQDNCVLADQEVCTHYLLEDASVPEEETCCTRCETNWFQRLQEAVERSVDNYTTAYPCMSEDRERAHIVPHLYQRCPHCKAPKANHVIQLVKELATALVGTNVLEVQADPGARTLLNFDARLFISATAAAYPELFRTTIKDWSEKTQASDLSGEVIEFITPVKSLHFNKVCNLECSNNGQSNLTRLAVDAFDRESVIGSKPKIWVTLVRTNRVKKDLAKIKGAAKEKPEVEVTEVNVSPMEEVDGGALVESAEPSGSGSNKTAPKKTKTSESDDAVTDTSARGEESAEQSVISGNAAKKIRPTLPLTTCYSSTRPEYARYFVNLGVGKIREICVLSRSLEFRNSVATVESVKSLPKWIPRQYIQVSSEVLLKRIRIRIHSQRFLFFLQI